MFRILKSVVDALPYDYADEVEKFRQSLLAHRFTGDAAPTAPSIIEQAITRIQQDGEPDDFVTSFEVIDDTPPGPTPAELRQRLIANLRILEQEAAAKIIGPGRSRILGIEVQAVHSKPEDERTDDERAKLAEFASVQGRMGVIQLHAAKAEADIDEAPDSQIEGWAIPAFPAA